jgi:hypothetical protein
VVTARLNTNDECVSASTLGVSAAGRKSKQIQPSCRRRQRRQDGPVTSNATFIVTSRQSCDFCDLHVLSCAGAGNAIGFPAKKRSQVSPTRLLTTWLSATTSRNCPWPPGTGASSSTCGQQGRGQPNLHLRHLLQKTWSGEPRAQGTAPRATATTRRLGNRGKQEMGHSGSSDSLKGNSSRATSTTRRRSRS